MTEEWQALRRRMDEAAASDPATAGRRLVYGEGETEHPRLCLIGEAPGAQEEAQGRPFVGKAGQNLNGFLTLLGLQREEIYITNTVKLRPIRVSAKGTVGNRPPSSQELALFVPLLLQELALLRPPLLVTLGNTALQALLGRGALIGDCHGRLLQAELPGGLSCPLFPLYHPAAIIYNRALSQTYEEDLHALKALMNH